MTNDSYQPFLRALRLSDAEIALYLALLETGPASIRTLAGAASVNRGSAYESLKRLVALGLASYKRRGERRQFVAESPECIHDLIEEQRLELAQLESSAQSLVPGLLALAKRRVGDPIVRFFEDEQGIAAILRDVLATASKAEPKLYRAYSSPTIRQFLYRRFPGFTRRRIQSGIHVNVIAIGTGGEPAELAVRKTLPAPTTEQASSYVLIYADKVAMISLSANTTPYGVVIEEAGVAATQRLLFDTLWGQLS